MIQKPHGCTLPGPIAARALRDVSRATGVSRSSILTADRRSSHPERLARSLAIWMLAEMGYSYPSIARVFRCDQSTVRYTHNRFSRHVQEGSGRHLDVVTRLLRGGPGGRRHAA